MFLAECGCCPPDPPKRYTCRDGVCVEDEEGEYDEPTCGGNCDLPCVCPGTCSYFIEIVQPSAIAVKSKFLRCGYGGELSQVITDSLITDLLPFSLVGQSEFPAWQNQSAATAQNNGSSFGVSVVHEARGFQGDIPEAGNQFAAYSTASLSVYCYDDYSGEPKYKAQLSISANARFLFESLGFTTTGQWGRSFYKEFELPASCVSAPDRNCSSYDNETLHITTPLTITLSGDGTSSLGNLDMTAEYGDAGVPPEFPYARDAVDAILDGLSYEFNITSTSSCDDPCYVLVDGVRVPVYEFDPYEVIAAEWRGLQAPGSDRLFIDGELISDNPASYDSLNNITRAGCDGAGQINDGKALFLAPGGAGIINVCVTSESSARYTALVCEAINASTARLYGGIRTLKVLSPCFIDGEPSSDGVSEENQWEWECFLVDGVPGEVTVSPMAGARYFNNEPVACGVTHEAPVVTLTFIP
jgi:hypothetical protein